MRPITILIKGHDKDIKIECMNTDFRISLSNLGRLALDVEPMDVEQIENENEIIFRKK